MSQKRSITQDQIVQFILAPDRESYLAMREIIVESEEYEPYSRETDTAIELYEAQKVQEARDTLQNGIDNLMLSPRAHLLLSFLNKKLGDEKASEMELMFGQSCIQGILATGDGSPEKPYLVLRTSDEYDLLEHLEKELEQQTLLQEGNRHFDRIRCKDGSEYWFDITDALNQLSKSLGH